MIPENIDEEVILGGELLNDVMTPLQSRPQQPTPSEQAVRETIKRAKIAWLGTSNQ